MREIHMATGLSEKEYAEVRQLWEACQAVDRRLPAYPYGEEDTLHFLAYEDGTPTETMTDEEPVTSLEPVSLVGAMAVCQIPETEPEVIAAVHPEYRRRGVGAALFEAVVTWCAEKDKKDGAGERGLCLLCAGAAPGEPFSETYPMVDDTSAVLKRLGAVLLRTELTMECKLDERSFSRTSQEPRSEAETMAFSLEVTSEEAGGDYHLELLFSRGGEVVGQEIVGGETIGQAFAFAISDTAVCLHHVEIEKKYRRRGCGTALLELSLEYLKTQGFREVLLQVHGDNMAAVGLYRKEGFAVREILSYYRYQLDTEERKNYD